MTRSLPTGPHPSRRLPSRAALGALALGALFSPACGDSNGAAAPEEQHAAQAPGERAVPEAARLAFERGRAAAARGLRLEAVAEYTAALEAAPDWAEPHRARAAVARLAGDLATARASYVWLMAAEPESAEHAAGLVHVGMRLGDLEAAQVGLERLVALEPGRARTHLATARVAFEDGRMGLAEREARQAARKDEGLAEAHYILGVAAEERGNTEAALAAWERALAADPGHLGARDLVATLLLREGRAAEAETQRALHAQVTAIHASGFNKLSPEARAQLLEPLVLELSGWAHAMRELAQAWSELGRDEEALQLLRASVKVENTTETHRLLHETLTRLGKFQAAERHGRLAGVLPAESANPGVGPR